MVCTDLNRGFPFRDNSFDVCFSTYVLEHLRKIDDFIKETYRVVKPGGSVIISTENLGSWHNIFALILGYHPFADDASYIQNVGNPLSPHYLEIITAPEQLHVKILTYQSLKEICEIHGFKVESIVGAGYFPFPGKLSAIFSSLDPRHSFFLTIKIVKPFTISTKNP